MSIQPARRKRAYLWIGPAGSSWVRKAKHEELLVCPRARARWRLDTFQRDELMTAKDWSLSNMRLPSPLRWLNPPTPQRGDL